MHSDVVDLHTFYESSLGQRACALIDQKIAQLWPDAVGDVIVGYGYAIPYINRYRSRAERVLALMPAQQGAMPWPSKQKNCVALTEEDVIPLPDNSVDRLILVHALETSEHVKTLLREAWRVLKDGGRLLIVAPNRRGFWARNPNTPFGMGHPYSGRQLFALIEESLFTPNKPVYGLFIPPSRRFSGNKFARFLERLGPKWFKKIGGIVLIEARKEVLSRILERPRAWRRRVFIPVAGVSQ